MDEACAICAIDLSGRACSVWRVAMPRTKVGEFDSELAEVFFEAFARGLGCTLHLRLLEGNSVHHIIEVCFKAFALALREAVAVDSRATGVPSTKGTLTQ
jgi:imidazoleglycerol-phosphate dehydratase